MSSEQIVEKTKGYTPFSISDIEKGVHFTRWTINLSKESMLENAQHLFEDKEYIPLYIYYWKSRGGIFRVYKEDMDECLGNSGWSKSIAKQIEYGCNIRNPGGMYQNYIDRFSVTKEAIQRIEEMISKEEK